MMMMMMMYKRLDDHCFFVDRVTTPCCARVRVCTISWGFLAWRGLCVFILPYLGVHGIQYVWGTYALCTSLFPLSGRCFWRCVYLVLLSTLHCVPLCACEEPVCRCPSSKWSWCDTECFPLCVGKSFSLSLGNVFRAWTRYISTKEWTRCIQAAICCFYLSYHCPTSSPLGMHLLHYLSEQLFLHIQHHICLFYCCPCVYLPTIIPRCIGVGVFCAPTKTFLGVFFEHRPPATRRVVYLGFSFISIRSVSFTHTLPHFPACFDNHAYSGIIQHHYYFYNYHYYYGCCRCAHVLATVTCTCRCSVFLIYWRTTLCYFSDDPSWSLVLLLLNLRLLVFVCFLLWRLSLATATGFE